MTHVHGEHNRHHDGNDPTDTIAGEAFWDARYSSSDALWSGNPNPHLLGETSALSPGSALDVGCGEGADAIWLAEHGWRVTAVDISTVALKRGADRAMEVGAQVAERITWLHADLTDWTPGAATYDLVSVQFMHLPKDPREALYRRLAESVAPGGTFLVVGHHPSDMQTSVQRPSAPDRFFTGDDVAALLEGDGWEIIVNAEPGRGATDPEGATVTVHDTVLRARRRT
ncbi:MAG: class I SAM-dependent methyltransferase [Chloroflexota bacterium]